MIYFVLVRNPLQIKETKEERALEYIPNTSLDNYIKSIALFDTNTLSISVNGEEEADLSRVLLDRDFVVVCPKVEKSALAVIATIALSYVSFGVGGLAAGAGWGAAASTWGAGTLIGTLASMAVMYVGGLLINSVFGLNSSETDNSTTYSWGSQDNLTNQGGAFPITYGTVRVTGQVIAQHVYSSDDNDDQYLNLLLCGGEGEADYISDIQINNNPISYFSDVTSEIRLGTNDQTCMEHFAETYSDQPLAYELTTHPAWESDHYYSIGDIVNPDGLENTYTCTQAGNSGDNHPIWASSGTMTDGGVIWEYRGSVWSTVQVLGNGGTSLEGVFECTNGLYYSNDDGGLDDTTVAFKMQFREVGTSVWKSAIGNGYIKLAAREAGDYVPSAKSSVIGGVSNIDPVLSSSVKGLLSFAEAVFRTNAAYDKVSAYNWNTQSGNCQFRITQIELLEDCTAGEVFTIKVEEVTSTLVHAHNPQHPISNYNKDIYLNEPTKLGVYSSVGGFLGYVTPNTYYSGGKIAFLATSQHNPVATTYDSDGNYSSTYGGQSYVGDIYTITVTGKTPSKELTGNTQDAVRKTIKINNIDENKNYEVRAMCSHKDGITSRYSNRLYWTTLSQVFEKKYTYPNSILIGIRALATDQLSGSKPSVSWIQTRLKVYIWNPYTGAYETKRADNPAWASYDILHRCKRIKNVATGEWEYSVEGASIEYFIYDEFLAWATSCDENGLDVNIHFDTTEDIWEQLSKIAEMGRGKVIRRGTRYGCISDFPSDMVQLFTVANIFQDSFTEEFLALTDRANCVEVSFFNEEKDYVEDVVTVYDKSYDETELMVNPAQKTYYGCTSMKRAIREGNYLMRLTNSLIRTVGIEVDIDAIACRVGDVIGIQHDVPMWGTGGRLISYVPTTVGDVTTYTITLDKAVALIVGKSYTILCRVVDTANVREVYEYKTFTATTTESTDVLVLEEGFDIAPEAETLFTFGETGKYFKKFRIINITRTQDLKRTIHGLEYIPEVYEEAEVIPEQVSYFPLAIKDAVTDLVAIPYFPVSSTGVVLPEIRVTWKISKGSAPDYYMIYAYGDNGEEYSARVYTTSYVFSPIKMGIYDIKVCAIYGAMVKNTIILGTDISEKTSPPNDVQNLVLTPDSTYPHVLHITWDAITNYDLDKYELRTGTSSWDTSVVITTLKTTNYDYVVENSGQIYIHIKAIDTSGNYSSSATSKAVTMVGVEFDEITGFSVEQLD